MKGEKEEYKRKLDSINSSEQTTQQKRKAINQLKKDMNITFIVYLDLIGNRLRIERIGSSFFEFSIPK